MENKSSISIKTAFLVFVLLFSHNINAADKAAFKGSFIQAWLSGSWSEEKWQKEFSLMKEAGMEYLVIGPLVTSAPGEVSKTLYPSSLPNTTAGPYGTGFLERVLKNAENSGIKVFLQISENSQWWTSASHDTSWLFPQMRFDNQVCKEVWALYKNKYPNAFHGWYFTYEENNVALSDAQNRNIYAAAINIQLDYLTANNIRLPFMWCPYMNSAMTTSDQNKDFWIDVFSQLHTTTGDIFCPQDCVGAGGLKIDQVDEWFAALRKAVDTKPGLLFWSDMETFDQTDWTSATVGRLVKQLKIEQPYVDDFITFAYCHYQSPNNTAAGYQLTYLDYLKNGVVETVAPVLPGGFNAVADSVGNVSLSWDAATDNIGVCGYYIYRNGIQIWKKQIGRYDGASSIAPLPVSLKDGSLSPNTDYTYELKVFDFAGNITTSSPVKINTGNFSYLANVVSKGRPYTVSRQADSQYPDTDNKELTNGSTGRTVAHKDPSFEGVYDQYKNTRYITIDLGSEQPVQQFIAYFLYDKSFSVSLPSQVSVSASSDNNSFKSVGSLNMPNIPYGTSISLNKCVYTSAQPVVARYIKFSVAPSSEWTFDNEFEVRSSDISAVDDNTITPAVFSLEQNYPNPFNPETVIKYKIAKEGYTTLKVFDILGREVKTLVNENKPAGSYNVIFNAGDISSGVYFYTLTQGSLQYSKKMIVIK
jgi:hypothetical protein